MGEAIRTWKTGSSHETWASSQESYYEWASLAPPCVLAPRDVLTPFSTYAHQHIAVSCRSLLWPQKTWWDCCLNFGMHHPCALGSNYLESSTAHESHQCPGLRENTVCSLSQTWKFQFYAATSALCVLTCVRGALLSISFPTFTELKDVSSKGKRRLLIVATPSLCPPKRMYMADQQGGGGVPARGHGHTHTHTAAQTEERVWRVGRQKLLSPSWAVTVRIPKSCACTLATCSMSPMQ